MLRKDALNAWLAGENTEVHKRVLYIWQHARAAEFAPDPHAVKYNPGSRCNSRHVRPRKAAGFPGNSGKCSPGAQCSRITSAAGGGGCVPAPGGNSGKRSPGGLCRQSRFRSRYARPRPSFLCERWAFCPWAPSPRPHWPGLTLPWARGHQALDPGGENLPAAKGGVCVPSEWALWTAGWWVHPRLRARAGLPRRWEWGSPGSCPSPALSPTTSQCCRFPAV